MIITPRTKWGAAVPIPELRGFAERLGPVGRLRASTGMAHPSIESGRRDGTCYCISCHADGDRQVSMEGTTGCCWR